MTLTAEQRDALIQRPLGVVLDIDGTLSPIAPTPDAARLYPGVRPLLEQLKEHAHVVIMTGRAVVDGARLVGVDDIIYIGNHGLEWSDGLPDHHQVEIAPQALSYSEVAGRLLDLAEQQLAPLLPGMIVQRKSVGGSIHYRLCADPELARRHILELIEVPAREARLHLSLGKMVVDVQVPGMNKGVGLRSFVQRFRPRGILFAGDDRTDLDAITELARLRQQGTATLAVVVRHNDTLPELLAQADLVVQEVEGMYELLQEIVEVVRHTSEI